MKQLCLLLAVASAGLTPALIRAAATPPFAGRWDLTITTPKDTYPSWMEFSEKDGSAKLRIVGRVSSVHPATDLKLEGSHLSFTTSEWFGKPIQVMWTMSVAGGKLNGTQKRQDGVQGKITGVHAPLLDRKAPAAWTDPQKLFNGKDLSGWMPDNPAENHWKAKEASG